MAFNNKRGRKAFAWSFSALESFELCPKKHHAEKIAKTVINKPNAAQNYGKVVHAAFEKRLISDRPLPLDLKHHEVNMAALYNAPGQGYPEQRMTLNANLELTGWFDNDAWVRSIMDYAKVNGPNALILDHKTGRAHDKFDQIDLMAAICFVLFDTVEHIRGAYYWTKEKRFTRKDYVRADAPEIWANFMPRVKRLEHAIANDEFPAKQNYLCKRHCEVKSCPYNGE